MESLEQALAQLLADGPARIVFSAARQGAPYRRAQYTLLQGGWQAEYLSETQAFHKNFPQGELATRLERELNEQFTRLTAFGQTAEHSLRITKKGRPLYSRHSLQTGAPPQPRPHDRPKAHLLAEGQMIPPLVDMGIFTPEGRVVQAMAHKYRQINRFVELVHDALKNEEAETIRVVDFGSGKSYLTFILYYYLTQIRRMSAQVVGLDLKADAVAASNAAAQKYGYEGLVFQVGDIASWQAEGPVDLVVSLHACDTATDHALANAVAWGAAHIFAVPCCQHELNAQMQSGVLPLLGRYGIVKERTAALFTDAIRANLLAAAGYRSQLVEFVDLAHTPKNLLLRAGQAALPAAKRRQALQEVHQLCAAFNLQPTLLRLLGEKGALQGLEKDFS